MASPTPTSSSSSWAWRRHRRGSGVVVVPDAQNVADPDSAPGPSLSLVERAGSADLDLPDVAGRLGLGRAPREPAHAAGASADLAVALLSASSAPSGKTCPLASSSSFHTSLSSSRLISTQSVEELSSPSPPRPIPRSMGRSQNSSCHKRSKQQSQLRLPSWLSCSNLLGASSQRPWTHQLRAFYLVLVVLCLQLQPIACCSSRSTPKPRPPSQSAIRPNITFQTYACPPAYAAWYCLNGATCFTVKIADSILYNCECADGYMGQRCEFKDLDGSYLPTRERLLELRNSRSGTVFIGVLLLVVSACLISAIYTTTRTKQKRRQQEKSCCDEEDEEEVASRSASHLDCSSSSTLPALPTRYNVSVLGQSLSYSFANQCDGLRYPSTLYETTSSGIANWNQEAPAFSHRRSNN